MFYLRGYRLALLVLIPSCLSWCGFDPQNLPLTENLFFQKSDLQQNTNLWLSSYANAKLREGKPLRAATAFHILVSRGNQAMLKPLIRSLNQSGLSALAILVSARNQLDTLSDPRQKASLEFIEYLDFMESFHKGLSLRRFSRLNPYIDQEHLLLELSAGSPPKLHPDFPHHQSPTIDDTYSINLYQQLRFHTLKGHPILAHKLLNSFPKKHYFMPHIQILRRILTEKVQSSEFKTINLPSGELWNLFARANPRSLKNRLAISTYPSLNFIHFRAVNYDLGALPYQRWLQLLKIEGFKQLCFNYSRNQAAPKALRHYLQASYQQFSSDPKLALSKSSPKVFEPLLVHWPDYAHPRQQKELFKRLKSNEKFLRQKNFYLPKLEIWFQDQALPYSYDPFGSSVAIASNFFTWSNQQQEFVLLKIAFLHSVIQQILPPDAYRGSPYPLWFFHALVNHFLNWSPKTFGTTRSRLRKQVHYPMSLTSLQFLPFSSPSRLDFLLYQQQCKEIGDQIWAKSYLSDKVWRTQSFLKSLLAPKTFLRQVKPLLSSKTGLLWLEP
jgi:hypothetical protein